MATDLTNFVGADSIQAVREERNKVVEENRANAIPFSKTKYADVKIDHPSRDPDYKRAVEIGKRRFAKMKFENEAQKTDYLRNIRRNDLNVVGLPEFYPPTVTRSCGFGDGNMPQLSCGHKAIRSSTKIDGKTGNAVTTLRCGYGHVEERNGL